MDDDSTIEYGEDERYDNGIEQQKRTQKSEKRKTLLTSI